MEQDDVGLDAEIAQLADSLLQVLEELRIEAGEIPVVRRRALERIIAAARSRSKRSAWEKRTCGAC